jgi:hypothetical protein
MSGQHSSKGVATSCLDFIPFYAHHEFIMTNPLLIENRVNVPVGLCEKNVTFQETQKERCRSSTSTACHDHAKHAIMAILPRGLVEF